MKAQRRQRLYMVLLIAISVSAAAALILVALNKNIDFFLGPSQVMMGQAPKHHTFRLGGIVKPGSVHYSKDNGTVSFEVTDKVNQVLVSYHGILPDLFQAGRSVVTQGELNNKGVFIADQVLAKHDNKYMPKQVSDALQAAKNYHHYNNIAKVTS